MSYAAASFNLGIGLGAAFGFVGSWRNANLAAASLCAANLIFVAATDTPPEHAGKGGKVSGVRRAATAPQDRWKVDAKNNYSLRMRCGSSKSRCFRTHSLHYL